MWWHQVESQSPESLSLSFWFHPPCVEPVVSQEMALDLLREPLANGFQQGFRCIQLVSF